MTFSTIFIIPDQFMITVFFIKLFTVRKFFNNIKEFINIFSLLFSKL